MTDHRILRFDSLDSTQRAASGEPLGTVVVADHQSAGQGRHGHTWHSEPETGLYCSIVLEPTPLLTLALGVATVDAIAQATGIVCDLRWPNDLMLDGRKVAGILVQLANGAAIAGIGINVGFAPRLPEMRYPGTALGGSVEATLETFTAALAARLAEWRREGFATVRAQWLAKAGPLGAEVDVKLGDELVRGRFGGVDGEGALLLETDSGPRRIVSGELLGRAA